MKDEISALERNKTWSLEPKQEGMNIIGVKWVFKLKYKADNTLDKLEARVVAKGTIKRKEWTILRLFLQWLSHPQQE